MSDARWFEVERAVASAEHHFRGAVTIFNGIDDRMGALDRYTAEMAFMHAMQAGHSSMESAFLRILDIFSEEAPTGARWHADLILRVGMPSGRRPRILDDAMREAADETRQFRNVAVRAYDNFKFNRARDATEAARLLANQFASAIAAFRAVADP
jgi:hypothetical protein